MQQKAFPEAEVHTISGFEARSPVVFAGFVGPGLVGPLAVGHMIKELDMTEIGYMRSKYLPPSTVFMSGRLRHPFRFYANSDGSICAIICEITLKMDGIYSIISAILDWAEKSGSGEITILDGVASDYHDDIAYCAAEEDLCRMMKDIEIRMIPQGFITGMPGGILNECLLRKIRGVALLARARKDGTDPMATRTLMEAVNRMYGTKIETGDLVGDKERIDADFEELSQKYARHRKEISGMYM